MKLRSHRLGRPAGRSQNVVIALLSAIFLALVVLIVVIARGTSTPVIPPPPPIGHKRPHKPVGDPNRIKETLKQGKTYRCVLKTGFKCRVEDEDWGVRTVTNMVYECEMVVNRQIEVNDGQRVVELRYFESSRNVKLLTNVDDVEFDFGVLGDLSLRSLEYLQPGTTEVIKAVQPLLVGMLKNGAEQVLQDKAVKAVAHIDSLAGKTVRVVYVDQQGVSTVEPVGCTLSQEEQDFLVTTAVVSDCHIMDLKISPGGSWSINAGQLAGLVDPSLRGFPEGEIKIKRKEDRVIAGIPTAELQVAGGVITINSSDSSQYRMGRFAPKGTLNYNLVDNYVQRAELHGAFDIEQVSKEHILFRARTQTQPELRVLYECSMK